MLGAAMKLINSDFKTFEFAFVGLNVSESAFCFAVVVRLETTQIVYYVKRYV